MELLEDLLGVIQGSHNSLSRARAALKYIVLALSGNMDDIMPKYKDTKHQILFLLEMLEPYLDPALIPLMGMIAFGNVSSFLGENQEENCVIALNVIRAAITKSAVLPSLEAEWRRGSVAPSVLLSVLDSQILLPPDIDNCKFSGPEPQENADSKANEIEISNKIDIPEDIALLFAPSELNKSYLTHIPASSEIKISDSTNLNVQSEADDLALNAGQRIEFFNLLADYSQLVNYRDCEIRACEFRRLAQDLIESTQERHDVAIDALLLAAECYINPCFMMSSKEILSELSKIHSKKIKNRGFLDIKRTLEGKNDLKLVTEIERKRDQVVLEILIEAAELDKKNRQVAFEGEILEGDFVNLNGPEILDADAVTLVRKNQALLCNFLIFRLSKNLDEILMWCLLFFLHSATKLFCNPDHIVDIILNFAETLNEQLKSFQFSELNSQSSISKLHQVQRRWVLLHRLVIASSGSDEGKPFFSVNFKSGFRFSHLIPPSVWIQKVPEFSSSNSPLVRYFGWMAVSRNAKQYLTERLFLVSDLSQLTYLLSIFSDDLSLVDNIIERKDNKNIDDSFHALYPKIFKFFPDLKKEFESFGETLLEAVGLQLKCLSSTIVPDLLCWFCDLCSWPFVQIEKKSRPFIQNSEYFKGFVTKNSKAVILYVLEAIVVEHMEAMVPEIPRVVQVLASLCKTSYADVAFLDSILRLLKPIIGYSMSKVCDEENLLVEDSCDNFESLCFGELFNSIRDRDENQREKGKFRALVIFVLANVFGDLSFHRKREVLKLTLLWADFASFEETSSFLDYICAYQVLMDSCKELLVGVSRMWGVIPVKIPECPDSCIGTIDEFSKTPPTFLSDICIPSAVPDVHEKIRKLNFEEVKCISEDLKDLVTKLNPTLEKCWKMHHKLAKKLTLACAECFVYSRCLNLLADKLSSSSELDPIKFADKFPDFWQAGLDRLTEIILSIQEKHQCWEVSSILLESLLKVPLFLHLNSVNICSAIKNFSCRAPNLSSRLKTDNFISLLLARDISNFHETQAPLVDLFRSLLGHQEPEQRHIGLKHLAQIVGQDGNFGGVFSSLRSEKLDSGSILSSLVSSTWDQVVLIASSDPSVLLRSRALALLYGYTPYAERCKLQAFLSGGESVLECITSVAHGTSHGPLRQLSLALIASVCLFSEPEDVLLVPESIWSNIETLGASGNDKYCTDLEKKVCETLCRLKNDEEQAKENLKDVLSSSFPKQQNLDFVATRESILQVIGNLSSAHSYFDFFSKEIDQKNMELEEAELEMELLQRENPAPDSSIDFQDWSQLPFLSTYAKDDNRLQQIKDEIKSMEKAKLREEIVARRQQKLLLRRSRQQFLEEAALREAELIQNFDRERTTQVERELERQHLLEVERAKTRELRHNLDMEKEKQAQRELQRELEQAESGLRPSRREFASSSNSRPRDRFRERDNARESNTVTPTVVLSGNRSFSGQPPTILQSRDRSEEYGDEDNFDGKSKDSGDTGSVGEAEMVAALEGGGGGQFGQRLGNRGGAKSRQIVERRDRGEGRREGKWERKH